MVYGDVATPMYYYAFAFSRAATIPCGHKRAADPVWGRMDLPPIGGALWARRALSEGTPISLTVEPCGLPLCGVAHPSTPVTATIWMPVGCDIAQAEGFAEKPPSRQLCGAMRLAWRNAQKLYPGNLRTPRPRMCSCRWIHCGYRVAGALGILSTAAQRRLVNLAEAFERIKRTGFLYRQGTMDRLLAETGPDHRTCRLSWSID